MSARCTVSWKGQDFTESRGANVMVSCCIFMGTIYEIPGTKFMMSYCVLTGTILVPTLGSLSVLLQSLRRFCCRDETANYLWEVQGLAWTESSLRSRQKLHRYVQLEWWADCCASRDPVIFCMSRVNMAKVRSRWRGRDSATGHFRTDLFTLSARARLIDELGIEDQRCDTV